MAIIGYDPAKQIFPSTVFGNMQSTPLTYQWDMQGTAVIHAGATYHGAIRDGGKTISGGWRPDPGVEATDFHAYDMTMYRVG